MRVKPEDFNTASASYPKFNPHITLVSQLPAAVENDPGILQSVIPQQDVPLKCRFASIDVGDAYFRSVLVAIKPSVQLLELHQKVHENLQIERKTPLFPHLSLVYITDEDAARGERMKYYDLLTSGRRFRGNLSGDVTGEEGVSLRYGPGEEEGWMDSFDATEVWAVKCDGPVESWEVKAKYPLFGKQI